MGRCDFAKGIDAMYVKYMRGVGILLNKMRVEGEQGQFYVG